MEDRQTADYRWTDLKVHTEASVFLAGAGSRGTYLSRNSTRPSLFREEKSFEQGRGWFATQEVVQEEGD